MFDFVSSVFISLCQVSLRAIIWCVYFSYYETFINVLSLTKVLLITCLLVELIANLRTIVKELLMREKSWWTNIAVFIMVQVDMVWPTLLRLVVVILTKNKLKYYMWIKPVKSIPQIMVMVDCLGKIKFKESLLKISRNGSSAEKWAWVVNLKWRVLLYSLTPFSN